MVHSAVLVSMQCSNTMRPYIPHSSLWSYKTLHKHWATEIQNKNTQQQTQGGAARPLHASNMPTHYTSFSKFIKKILGNWPLQLLPWVEKKFLKFLCVEKNPFKSSIILNCVYKIKLRLHTYTQSRQFFRPRNIHLRNGVYLLLSLWNTHVVRPLLDSNHTSATADNSKAVLHTDIVLIHIDLRICKWVWNLQKWVMRVDEEKETKP